jgi:pectin methylesterase-like acyl-CoA thioesterase
MRPIPPSLLAVLISLFALARPVAAQPANVTTTDLIPLPANHATGVCPDTLLTLTFPTPPTLGTGGQVRIYDSADNHLVDTVDIGVPDLSQDYTIGGAQGFHLHPIIINGNVATIYPHHHLLDYNKTYSVQIDPGVLLVGAAPFPGYNGTTAWVFTTKAAPPAADASRLEVAANGKGDFATVQGALDFVPAHNTRPVTIHIESGNYTEIVYFADKSNLTILGADRTGTVIGYANNDKFNSQPGTNERPGPHFYYRSSFMGNHVTDIKIVNLTLKNTTPKGGSQAEALILSGGQNIVTQVNLSSLQDTLQINDSAYVSDCYIEGDVDFMWGRGPVFFQDCTIQALNRGYYTQIRNTAANHGYVYVHCTFDGTAKSAGSFLARIDPTRFPNSEVVLIDCALGASVSPVGWRFDGGATTAPNVHFWEYNSTNVSDGKPADVSRRAAFSKQLTLPADAATIANYRDPAFVLGGWTPAMAPIFVKGAKFHHLGQTYTFEASAVGIPSPAYQWLRNGVALSDSDVVSGATTTTLTLTSPKPEDLGEFKLVATNSAGSATSEEIGLLGGSPIRSQSLPPWSYLPGTRP